MVLTSKDGGINLNYSAVSTFVSEMRMGKKVDSSWKSKIDEDYKKRGKKGPS